MPGVGRAVFLGIGGLLCAVERANDLHPGYLPGRDVDRVSEALAEGPVIGEVPCVFEGFCDSSRKPHGSPVSSSLFRSTGRSTVVAFIWGP